MNRLTDPEVAANLKENLDALSKAGIEPSVSDLRYIKLSSYEDKEKVITVGDWIRTFSNKELARFIYTLLQCNVADARLGDCVACPLYCCFQCSNEEWILDNLDTRVTSELMNDHTSIAKGEDCNA